MPTEETKPENNINRNTATISASKDPVVFFAKESITWNGGVIPICGLGATRVEALGNLDIQFESLKKLLNIK